MCISKRLISLAVCIGFLGTAARAQTPPPPAKRLPPAGVEIPAGERAKLTADVAAFRKEIDAVEQKLRAAKSPLLERMPDVEIFHKAVDWALRYDEFFTTKEPAFAGHLLKEGRERLADLRQGKAPWLTKSGLVVRGYRSKLDGSIQPYGLVVPTDLPAPPYPMEVWLLGRGEKRTELAFLEERENPKQEPGLLSQDTITVVPYGRFCNATKFAGEVDVFEAMDAVKKDYTIDPLRTSVAGFSMGGASVWHLATHHSGLWSSASPGAGFAETPVYTKAFDKGKEPPTWWEQKLWGWYDATLYANNLFNCPTVAYSGEIDPQKQSADVMEKAMAAEGLKLERFIGPQTAHKYEPKTREALLGRVNQINGKGRPIVSKEVRISTYTLRYPDSEWLTLEGLEHHWERADAQGRVEGTASLTAFVTTKNVTALSIDVPEYPVSDHLYGPAFSEVVVDGDNLKISDSPQAQLADQNPPPWITRPQDPTSRIARFIRATMVKNTGHWTWASAPLENTPGHLRKLPGSTGPVDDAFMDAFVFVRPTGQAMNAKVGQWVDGELKHATKMWRDIFRGELAVEDDAAVSEAEIASKNLVLWGDPASNKVLARIVAKLPLTWDKDRIVFRGKTYDAAHHAPILIFPNPLNPAHYVVLNSGIDFRDHAYGTNALQIAKLPDYAIVDLDTPPGPRWPGKIVEAGFFDESWK